MSKSSKKRKNNHRTKINSSNNMLLMGAAVLVLGLLFFGMRQVTTEAGGLGLTGTTRDSQFLGPASDPEGLALAEAGEVGQPTLVWFHADWCHVCQQIKPEMVNMGEEFQGEVKFVRLNVDHPQNRAALGRYGVRATPTFVLIDAQGQPQSPVAGWPGYQAFSTALQQLLEQS